MQRLKSAIDDKWIQWLIFGFLLLIFWLFPTKNYYWDGIFFARVIEDARGVSPSLLHPNHLLYNVVGYFLYKCTRALGLNWRAVEVLQFANSVVSVLTAWLLFRVLKRCLQSGYLSWTLTLLFAFSATWWKFSTDANAYVLSVFFLLLAFYFLLPDTKPRPLLVALIFSVSVLLHQLAVLCYPILALGLWWQASSSTKKRNLIVLEFCVLAFVLVFDAYVYCFYLISGTSDPGRLARWVTSYSPDASFSFDALSNLGYTLRGHIRLFFSGRFSLLKGLVTPAIIGLFCILIAVLLLWLFLMIRGIRKVGWPSLREVSRERVTRLAALWIVIYLAFLFFWLPHNTFYRLFYLPAIIILLGQVIKSRIVSESRKRSYRLALFVAAMALANFLFFIFPYAHAEKYPPLSAALEMNSIWRPGTVVFYAHENSDNNLFQYFNRETEWKPLPEVAQLDAEIRNTYENGREAWLETTAIDELKKTPTGASWFARHAQTNTLRERLDTGYNIRFIKVSPEICSSWRPGTNVRPWNSLRS